MFKIVYICFILVGLRRDTRGCIRSSGNGMTMEERLNSLLSETEDVAEKDKIYLNGLVRGSEARFGLKTQNREQIIKSDRFKEYFGNWENLVVLK